MPDHTPLHSAAQSAAGYFYQARFALAECLKFAYVDSDIEVAIEKFDDVSFERDGTPIDLLQTKHHLKRSGDLSNASVDLWKTIRVWCSSVNEDPSLPSRTRFALITTALAPSGSAADFLRPKANGNPKRDVKRAEKILRETAESSENKEIAKAFEAFLDLTAEMRVTLLGSVEIIDRAPLIADLEALIEERLRMIAPRGKSNLAREQIEGWWWPRICSTLRADEVSTISIIEVEQKLDDIRESLKRDALPTDMEHFEPPEAELATLEEFRFVGQLRSAGVGSNRLQFAKRDFYRAFTQRSKWTRLNLLFDGEVAQFEAALIEEWEPRFARMCDTLDDDCDDDAIHQSAQDLYYWVETEARFPFRTIVSRFLNVGSFHMLANEARIGWHRDYQKLHPIDNDDGAVYGT